MRCSGGAITDRAVGYDWCIFREQRDRGRRIGIRKDEAGARQMAHLPFRAAAHIEQDRLELVSVGDPVRQLCSGDPLHIGELAAERALEEKPVDAPTRKEPERE